MSAGRYRHLITIQQRSTAISGGAQSDTWSTFVTSWADVQPITGREPLVGRQEIATATHRVTMRYRGGVTASMRVLYRGRLLNIAAVLNINERDRELELLCVEVINA